MQPMHLPGLACPPRCCAPPTHDPCPPCAAEHHGSCGAPEAAVGAADGPGVEPLVAELAEQELPIQPAAAGKPGWPQCDAAGARKLNARGMGVLRDAADVLRLPGSLPLAAVLRYRFAAVQSPWRGLLVRHAECLPTHPCLPLPAVHVWRRLSLPCSSAIPHCLACLVCSSG